MIDKQKNNTNINVLTYALLQIVNLLVGLFIPRLLLKVYGSEINGAVSTVNGFITYFSFLEAGLGLTLIHSLFKPLTEKNYDNINSILVFSKRKYIKISVIYFALVVVLSLLYPIINNTSAMNYTEYSLLIFVIGSYGALDFYSMGKYRVLLTADQKEYVISIAMIVAQFVRFIVVLLFLQFNLSIVIVKVIPILTLLIRTLILKIYIAKKYPDISFNGKEYFSVNSSNKRFSALLLQISISTSVSFPVIVISTILGYTEANIFAVYFLVVNAVISLISALSSGAAPTFGKALSRNENIEKSYNVYEFIVSFVVTSVFSTTVFMFIPFIRIYTNNIVDVEYVYPIYALLFSLFGAAYSMRIPCTALLNAKGLYKENLINNIINLLIQVVMGVIFTIFFKIPGMIVALIISSLHRNISLSIINQKYIFSKNSFKFIFKNIIMFIVIIFFYKLSSMFTLNSNLTVLQWILYSFITFIFSFFVTLILNLIVDFKNCKYLFIKFVKKYKK